MKTISTLALVAALGAATITQAQPSGGPNAKGNAPLKAVHTVNDGAAKPGANSFTQNQARKHILNSGYTAVSGLAKGADGVWRGTAVKDGASVAVALDFKGNVSEAGPAPGAAPASVRPASASVGAPASVEPAVPPASASVGAPVTTTTHHVLHHHRRHHHHHTAASSVPGRSGVAMSGIDRNHNGVSDKEDRAHDKIPHP